MAQCLWDDDSAMWTWQYNVSAVLRKHESTDPCNETVSCPLQDRLPCGTRYLDAADNSTLSEDISKVQVGVNVRIMLRCQCLQMKRRLRRRLRQKHMLPLHPSRQMRPFRPMRQCKKALRLIPFPSLKLAGTSTAFSLHCLCFSSPLVQFICWRETESQRGD